MCGSSMRALEALRRAGAPITAVDVLPDPQIRQELSTISSWPTIPQVFVRGELIGGADIVEELEASGELQRTPESRLGRHHPRAAGENRRPPRAEGRLRPGHAPPPPGGPPPPFPPPPPPPGPPQRGPLRP